MTRNVRGLWAVIVISLALFGRTTHAADPPRAESITTVVMQVSAAPEPRFALQYLFEIPYEEQESGNAAFAYQTAIGEMMRANTGDGAIDNDTLRRWYDEPIDALSVEEVRSALARFAPAFRYLEAAARYERCTWEYPSRAEGTQYMMPLLTEYRTLFRLAVAKVKVEMYDGRIDDALRTLRSTVALGRDLGAGPNLIQHLVGLSIAAGTMHQIETLIQNPDAPNLYWALSVLPRPLVDYRRAMQMEAGALWAQLPELRTLEKTVLSNDQVLALWKRTELWSGYDEDHSDRWIDKVVDLATVMERYPHAKAHLIAEGYAADKVEAWPALYVVLLDQYHQYRALRDMSFKWTYVPYAQAVEGLKRAETASSSIWTYGLGSVLVNPFVNTLPAMYRISLLDSRLARDIAMLRCVEAIRMYAAANNGTLPDTLSEITSVPVPLDPFQGEPFEYERVGAKAILTSPIPPDGHVRDARRYEITLR